MREASPPRAHDRRLDQPGDEHPGVSPGPVDLIALEATRMALSLAAPGLLLVLLGVIPLGEALAVLGPLLLVLRAAGWALLALALALSAPTPNGPLPRWLKPLYVLACAGGAVRVVYHRFLNAPALDQLEQLYVRLLWLAFLALPWILWRFTQHRGLTGRAITWLWCALALATVFVVNWVTRSSWALWLCPLIGVVLMLNARLTARDVWLDAVYKNARANRPASTIEAQPLA